MAVSEKFVTWQSFSFTTAFSIDYYMKRIFTLMSCLLMVSALANAQDWAKCEKAAATGLSGR